MTNQDSSGPAFPNPGGQRPYGMTLRHWFAGQAIVGILADPNFNWNLSSAYTPEEMVAKRAFAIADAAVAQALSNHKPD